METQNITKRVGREIVINQADVYWLKTEIRYLVTRGYINEESKDIILDLINKTMTRPMKDLV